MKCPFHARLSPYLDGELDRLEAKKMKEHVEACAACREELNFLLEIRDSLKQAAASAKVPASLREKILGETHQARSAVFILRRNLAYVLPLVAMLLVAAIWSFYSHWPWEQDSFRHIVATVVEYHSAYESGERAPSIRSSNLKDAELWLKEKVGFEILVPRAAFAGYNLVGVDVFEHRGKKFAYLKYQEQNKTIGYVVFKDLTFPIDLHQTMNIGEITFYFGQIKETNVGAWQKGGFVYVIMTTEDRSELIEYARNCIQLF